MGVSRSFLETGLLRQARRGELDDQFEANLDGYVFGWFPDADGEALVLALERKAIDAGHGFPAESRKRGSIERRDLPAPDIAFGRGADDAALIAFEDDGLRHLGEALHERNIVDRLEEVG